MNIDQIEKFLTSRHISGDTLRIDFRTRSSTAGIFLKNSDYDDLKLKNFWRVVTGENIVDWKRTQNTNLSKIISGNEITKLSLI